MSSSSQLQDKVMVVTGASSGIGEAIALMAASRGAQVMLCGRDQDRLAAARNKCVKASGGHEDRFATVSGDLTISDVRTRVVKATQQHFGRLDVLVANAGINLPDCSILTASEATYDQLMDTNVKSVFFLIQEAVPALEQAQGCIVNISSVASVMGYSPNIIYPMAKAAIDHMTRCLALDLAPRGIRVNSVNPSFVWTRIQRHAGDDAANDAACAKTVASEIKNHPYQGRNLKAEEVAESVMFFASSSSSFVTGQCLLVAGGRNLMGPLGKTFNPDF